MAVYTQPYQRQVAISTLMANIPTQMAKLAMLPNLQHLPVEPNPAKTGTPLLPAMHLARSPALVKECNKKPAGQVDYDEDQPLDLHKSCVTYTLDTHIQQSMDIQWGYSHHSTKNSNVPSYSRSNHLADPSQVNYHNSTTDCTSIMAYRSPAVKYHIPKYELPTEHHLSDGKYHIPVLSDSRCQCLEEDYGNYQRDLSSDNCSTDLSSRDRTNLSFRSRPIPQLLTPQLHHTSSLAQCQVCKNYQI